MEQDTPLNLDITTPISPGIVCPYCQQLLVTLEINPAEQIRCSGCGTMFYQVGMQPQKKVSVKAILSLILGLISPVGNILTAIPAILLGLLAVRDIRGDSQLKGMPLAVSGITFGMIFLITCGGLLFAVISIISSANITADPATVHSRASDRFVYELPPGVGPKSAQQILGIEEFQFGGLKPATHIAITYHPNPALLNPQDQLENTRRNAPGKLIANEDLEMKGDSARKQILQMNGGGQMRRYSRAFEGELGYLIVVVSVRDNPATDSEPLEDQQVVRFLESIKLVE